MDEEHIPVLEAVEQLIQHVNEQNRDRQIAKDAKEHYVPTNEQKIKRDHLLRQVLSVFDITRAELCSKIRIDRATWDRWRNMSVVPQRKYMEDLTLFARGEPFGIENNKNPLIVQAAPAMLDVLGITKLQLEELEWLERVQFTAGIELSEGICRTLLDEYRKAPNCLTDNNIG